MNKRLRKFCTAALTGVLLAGALPLGAFADEPYDVYNYDRWGEAIPSQAGYIAERSVSGEDLGISHFANPSDIFRDYQNQFYVCDKGNNRIVVVDTERAGEIYPAGRQRDHPEKSHRRICLSGK